MYRRREFLAPRPADRDPFNQLASMPDFVYVSSLPQPETDPKKKEINIDEFLEHIVPLIAESPMPPTPQDLKEGAEVEPQFS